MAVNEQGRTQDLAIPEDGPMIRALEGEAPPPAADTSTISKRITERMLAARTPEELVNAGKAIPLEALQGVPLEVHELVLRPSNFEGEGLPVYAILDVVRGDDGSQLVVTTSAENVVRTLAIAHDRGWLPFKFKARKSERPTERGFYPFVVESV